MIRVECPGCGKRLRAEFAWLSKVVKCPKCSRRFCPTDREEPEPIRQQGPLVQEMVRAIPRPVPPRLMPAIACRQSWITLGKCSFLISLAGVFFLCVSMFLWIAARHSLVDYYRGRSSFEELASGLAGLASLACLGIGAVLGTISMLVESRDRVHACIGLAVGLILLVVLLFMMVGASHFTY